VVYDANEYGHLELSGGVTESAKSTSKPFLAKLICIKGLIADSHSGKLVDSFEYWEAGSEAGRKFTVIAQENSEYKRLKEAFKAMGENKGQSSDVAVPEAIEAEEMQPTSYQFLTLSRQRAQE